MFGGCPKYERGKSYVAQQKLAKTAILDFGEQNTHMIISCTITDCLIRKRKLVITLDIGHPYKP